MDEPRIRHVLFDFGGVIADEGFKEALALFAEREGLDPREVIAQGFKTGYDLGFCLGRVREDAYWPELRRRTGLRAGGPEIREQIFSRYRLRSWMLDLVDRIRDRGVGAHLLSDQSHWLDDLDRVHGFYRRFDQVFCSFHMGMSKKQVETFHYVLERLGAAPERVLFVDDHPPNLTRAGEAGLCTVLYRSREQVLAQIGECFGFLDLDRLSG